MIDLRVRRRLACVARPAALCLMLTTVHGAALAASSGDQETWRAECGSCHVPFPARSLAAGEWSQVLGALDRHYGVDASLGAQELAAVSRYLGVRPGAATAGSAAALPRITTSPWFRKEHDEVPVAAWRRPSVKSAANCAACHPAAEQGRFDEDSIRIPK